MATHATADRRVWLRGTTSLNALNSAHDNDQDTGSRIFSAAVFPVISVRRNKTQNHCQHDNDYCYQNQSHHVHGQSIP